MMFSANIILMAFFLASFTTSAPISTRHIREASVEIHTQRKLLNGNRHQSKRAPADPAAASPIAGLVGTATSTVGSLPVIGVPLSGLLSSLPLSSFTQPGAVSGIVGTVAGAASNLPLLGDLLKSLPLQSIMNGNPIGNLANTLSGVTVGLPVIGQPLSGAINSAAGLASSLPLSFQDIQRSASGVSSSLPASPSDILDASAPSQVRSASNIVSSAPVSPLDILASSAPSQVRSATSVASSAPVSPQDVMGNLVPSQIRDASTSSNSLPIPLQSLPIASSAPSQVRSASSVASSAPDSPQDVMGNLVPYQIRDTSTSSNSLPIPLQSLPIAVSSPQN